MTGLFGKTGLAARLAAMRPAYLNDLYAGRQPVRRPDTMTSYTPTIPERAFNGVTKGLMAAGVPQSEAALYGRKAQDITGIIPFVGDVAALEDGYRLGASGAAQGDMGKRLSGTGLMTLAALPIPAGMKKFRPAKTAETIARQLKAMGFTVGRDGSALSQSQYVTAALYDAADNPIVDQVKIRVSDHALPPTYGRMNGWADYEVGPHPEAITDWSDVVNQLAGKAGINPPSATKAAQTRLAKIAAARADEKERYISTWGVYDKAIRDRNNAVDMMMYQSGGFNLDKAARKQARKEYYRQYDEQNGVSLSDMLENLKGVPR